MLKSSALRGRRGEQQRVQLHDIRLFAPSDGRNDGQILIEAMLSEPSEGGTLRFNEGADHDGAGHDAAGTDFGPPARHVRSNAIEVVPGVKDRRASPDWARAEMCSLNAASEISRSSSLSLTETCLILSETR